MARSSISRSRVIRNQRRKVGWTVGPRTTAGGQVITGTGKVGATIAVAINADAITMVRLRGEMLFYLTAATALADGFDLAVGLAVVSDQAFAVGVTAIPGPLAEDNWDGWFYHRYVHIAAGGPIVAANVSLEPGQVNSTSAAVRFEVDGKAMRKVKEGDSIVTILEATLAGTATMKWHFTSRMLFKFP